MQENVYLSSVEYYPFYTFHWSITQKIKQPSMTTVSKLSNDVTTPDYDVTL